MHQAQAYINSLNWVLSSDRTLTVSEVTTLQHCLKNDAVDLFYSASLTFAQAITGVEKGAYSWSIVKFYYSVFYALRCYMALDGTTFLYFGTKPRILRASLGEKLIKGQNLTHKMVLKEFCTTNPGRQILLQDIDYKSPLDWLMSQREAANYKNPRFPEPNVPDCLESVVERGVRGAIETYRSDTNLYWFEKEHAILALPLKIISMTATHAGLDKCIGIEDLAFLQCQFRDGKGLLPFFGRMFSS